MTKRGDVDPNNTGFCLETSHSLHRADDDLQRADRADSEKTTSRQGSRRRSASADDKLRRRDPWADGQTGHDTERHRQPIARPVEQLPQARREGAKEVGVGLTPKKATVPHLVTRKSLATIS